MEQPNGNPCPECGAPRNSDNTPSCACTRRASDALRDARTAEAAAAEDFDPLRIRPYVELDGGTGAAAPDGAAEAAGAPETPAEGPGAPEAAGAPGAADETMALRAVPPEEAPGAADATSVLPTPLAPGTARPNATDLHLFDTTRPLAAVPAAPDGPAGTGGTPPRRRRRGTLFAVAGAVVAVVGAAGWASGMFSYETPSRDGAAPEDVRASVPDPSSAPPSAEPTAGASSAAPTSSASPSTSPSASASTSASPSPSASTAPASPSRSAEPSPTPTTTAPADSAEDTEEDEGGGTGPVLRRGDQGAEVVELQQRLHEKWLYNEEIHGRFDQRVEDALRSYQWSKGLQAELGVYGPQTRARLEAETREP
ncbi:peptidoglycan-binding domain-containing protein [Streptomyces sp. NPDC044984]|uniref:peptidoglycan-binding domain-containing protein n=1 Tax=Streptomyces sp. NPDC044984 TaxID=3154335 RepID=UPI0034112435